MYTPVIAGSSTMKSISKIMGRRKTPCFWLMNCKTFVKKKWPRPGRSNILAFVIVVIITSSLSSAPPPSFQARVNSPFSPHNCCCSLRYRPAVALIFPQTRRGQKDTCLQPMKAPSTASSPTLMSSILLPMTTSLKDQNCFTPQDARF
jgi:hypothetical protein